MTARCDKCETIFDSHDGGTIIDGVTYCPECEPDEIEKPCFFKIKENSK